MVQTEETPRAVGARRARGTAVVVSDEITSFKGATMSKAVWLWEEDGVQWLPQGEFTLLAGRAGDGKSTLAYKLVSQITTGTLPGADYGTPKSVLVKIAEEDPFKRVLPRLHAAGADIDRVEYTKENFSIPEKLDVLEELFASGKYSLFLIDPVVSIFEKADIKDYQEASRELLKLVAVAHRYGVTILGITHFTKAVGSNPINRIMGSGAFVSIARSVLMVCEEEISSRTYLLGQAKNSYGELALSCLRYVIEAHMATDEKTTTKTSKLTFKGRVDTTITEAILSLDQSFTSNRSSSRVNSDQWLKNYLEVNGSTSSAEVREEAKEVGISAPTLYRAASRLGVVSTRSEGTRDKTWSLPDLGSQLSVLMGATERTEVSSHFPIPRGVREVTEVETKPVEVDDQRKKRTTIRTSTRRLRPSVDPDREARLRAIREKEAALERHDRRMQYR